MPISQAFLSLLPLLQQNLVSNLTLFNDVSKGFP